MRRRRASQKSRPASRATCIPETTKRWKEPVRSKPSAQRVGEAGAVAEEHGVEHAGVVGGEAERARAGGGWAWSGCRRAGGRRPRFARRRCGIASAGGERASERGLWRSAVCDDAEFGGGDVGGGGDALVEQVVGVLPGAGIAVALGRAQAKRELRRGRRSGAGVAGWLGLRIALREERGADRRRLDGDHAGGVGRDVFDGGDGEVEGGGGRGVSG